MLLVDTLIYNNAAEDALGSKDGKPPDKDTLNLAQQVRQNIESEII